MARNDWMFAIFGWDPEYERKVPPRRKMQFTLFSMLIGISFGGACVIAVMNTDGVLRLIMFGFLFAGVAALSGYNWLLRRELIDRLELERDQQAASAIQRGLVPDVLPTVPGYDLAHHYSPFALIGGDYYDAVCLDDGRVVVTMADVSGKGTGAALLTANLQAILRFSDVHEEDLATVAKGINRHLVAHTEPERFVTLVVAVLDPQRRRLTYVNAGHNPPLGLGPDGSVLRLEATGVPLGSFPDAPQSIAHVDLPPGTTLVLYTDGLSERANPNGEIYDEERILAVLRRGDYASSKDVVDALVDDTERFSRGRSRDDDTAVLVIRAT